MKRSKKTTVVLLFSVVFMSVFTSCKKETDDNTNTTSTTKTLNKSLLVGKKWYSQGSTFVHDIKTGGVYSVSGTWAWKNNSDTMIVDLDGVGTANQPQEWKFYWSTDHEMACKLAKSVSNEILFKDQVW